MRCRVCSRRRAGQWLASVLMNLHPQLTEAADVAAMNLKDMVLHAWDLAVATGLGYALPDDTAQAVARAVAANAELFRQYQGFAEPVAVPPDASALDRALAASGRDPRWARDRG